jgi:hypothetical protein
MFGLFLPTLDYRLIPDNVFMNGERACGWE